MTDPSGGRRVDAPSSVLSCFGSLAVPDVAATDARKLDVVASGLPLYGGRAIVVDATLHSALTGAGMWRLNSHVEDGATSAQAVRDKNQTYPELASQGQSLEFIVAATEV